jgi:hypothetical protein
MWTTQSVELSGFKRDEKRSERRAGATERFHAFERAERTVDFGKF